MRLLAKSRSCDHVGINFTAMEMPINVVVVVVMKELRGASEQILLL